MRKGEKEHVAPINIHSVGEMVPKLNICSCEEVGTTCSTASMTMSFNLNHACKRAYGPKM